MKYYLIVINLLSFFLYGIDKYKSIKRKYRISEISLYLVSMFGGCFLGIIGMKLFHHKTRKISFWIVNILGIIIWGYLIIKYKWVI